MKPAISEAELESIRLHDTLYKNASRLDAIFNFATNPNKNSMPEIPGLPDEAAEFLQTWKGVGVVAAWAVAAEDTHKAINDFVQITLSRGSDLLRDVPHIETVIEAQDIAVSSLVERISHFMK